MIKYVPAFISKLEINFAVFNNGVDETCRNNRLLFVPSCYEVVVLVATSGRYGCAIVKSHTEISKVVSQWPLTCAFV